MQDYRTHKDYNLLVAKTKGLKKQACSEIEDAFMRGYKAGREREKEKFDESLERIKETTTLLNQLKGRKEAWGLVCEISQMSPDDIKAAFTDDFWGVTYDSLDEVVSKINYAEAEFRLTKWKQRKAEEEAARENPETRVEAFFERYPKADKNDDGTPKACYADICNLGGAKMICVTRNSDGVRDAKDCKTCWGMPYDGNFF